MKECVWKGVGRREDRLVVGGRVGERVWVEGWVCG